MRDPTVDPQYGDIVRSTVYKNGRERHAFRREGPFGNEVVYFAVTEAKSVTKRCGITTWQDWCRRNRVAIVQRAEDLQRPIPGTHRQQGG